MGGQALAQYRRPAPTKRQSAPGEVLAFYHKGGGKLACAHGGHGCPFPNPPPPFWPAVTGQ